jgi:hypothetical protein
MRFGGNKHFLLFEGYAFKGIMILKALGFYKMGKRSRITEQAQ